MKKLVILGAALALAVGTAYAEKGAIEKSQEKGGVFNNESSFRVLDKNNDGYLSKAEAAANADLAQRFAQADGNKDGKLSRVEYAKVMIVIDTHNASDKVSKKTDGKKDTSASGGTKQK